MIELPIRIESTLNKREHYMAKARRAKMHRQAAHWMCQGRASRPAFPVVVRLIRIAPRELDTDNLAGGLKSVRDGIADWLGINDNDCRVSWVYAQEKGEPLQYAVRIEFA